MKPNFDQHCTEESLERYAMGSLDEEGVEVLEEHILFCEECRVALDEWDRYVHAMKAGAARLREESESVEGEILERVKSWFALPMPGLAAAALVLCAIVLISAVQLQHRRAVSMESDVPVALSLVAERGGSISAPAHRILDLNLDARGLTLGPSARVEVVDARGAQVQVATVPQKGETLALRTTKPLPSGAYFVRLYRGNSSDPAREFALEVR